MNILLRLYYNIKFRHVRIHISKYFITIDNVIYDIYDYNKKQKCYVITDGVAFHYWKIKTKELIEMEVI